MNNQMTQHANAKPVLRAENLHYAYGEKNNITPVLAGVSFDIFSGDRLAIIGSSGSGKSTLLHLLGGLDRPQQGQILLGDTLFNAADKKISQRKQGDLRNQHLGFVYQFHHLLPEFSALENVMMPCLIRGDKPKQAQIMASELLDKVGISQQQHHNKPSALSGGQRQRVAIARAMVTKPDCILADEPTGNLDEKTAQSVMQLLTDLQVEVGTALVIVTHDQQIARSMHTVYRLQSQQLFNLSSY